VVDTVDGSPAAKAGLQEGDEILVFDGTPAAELTVQSMWQRVQQCKDRITLRIRRDGKESDVDVQLRPLI
jgi:C-terminal processing protease CtpA/Prc